MQDWLLLLKPWGQGTCPWGSPFSSSLDVSPLTPPLTRQDVRFTVEQEQTHGALSPWDMQNLGCVYINT